jgi:hypothetical protein
MRANRSLSNKPNLLRSHWQRGFGFGEAVLLAMFAQIKIVAHTSVNAKLTATLQGGQMQLQFNYNCKASPTKPILCKPHQT